MIRTNFLLLLVSVATAQTVIDIPINEPLYDLPGNSLLQPKKLREVIDIDLIPATIRIPGRSNDEPFLEFNAPVYKDKNSVDVFIFGPTLRLKRNITTKVTLSNKLFNPESDSEVQFNIGETNYHTHGLHDSPGLLSQQQQQRVQYTGGDNIFYHIQPNETLPMSTQVPENHMPGLHWYHPHLHGSTTSQAFTANGVLLVEDDPIWLPNTNGCKEVRTVMETVSDTILHIGVFTFAPSYNASLPIWMDANYQVASLEGNSTICCSNSTDTDNGENALEGPGSNQDIAVVNGGLTPIISMVSGEWQRFRMVHTGYKRFMPLQIIDEDTNEVATDCEMQLLAKDGIYLLEIPRPIDYILLTSGGRAEFLLRCKGAVGKKFKLSSGRQPFPYGAPGSAFLALVQDKLATFEITNSNANSTASSDLTPRSCTPLRPSYAADLRDTPSQFIVTDPGVEYSPSPTGCYLGGQNFSFPDPAPYEMPMGKVVRWDVSGLQVHPLHNHVNPFQILDLPDSMLQPNSTWTSYFEPGDHHDTLHLVMALTGNHIPLLTQPGPFGGYGVIHCHFLQHEDGGCMRVVKWSCQDGDEQPEDCTGKFEYPVMGTFEQKNMPPSPPPAPPAPPPSSGGEGMMSVGMMSVVVVIVLNALLYV